MVEPISLDIGTRPVGTDLNQVVQAYNRELIPLVKAMRRAINDLIGASDGELIVDADISDEANISVEKLEAGTDDGQVVQTIGETLAHGFIVNDNVDPDAQIAVSKLAPGTDGQTLKTSAGVASWEDDAGVDYVLEYVNPFLGYTLTVTSSTPSDEFQPSASVTTYLMCWFDASMYPESLGALTRSVYIEIIGMSASANAVVFTVFNETDGETVTATTSITGTTPSRRLQGPLDVGSDSGDIKESLKEYRIQGDYVGSSAAARPLSAKFLVRYA